MAAKRRPSRLASAVCVLAVVGAVAGCSQAPHVQATTTTRPRPGTPSNPVAPSIYSAGANRFVESVEVGGKVLVVTPAPKEPFRR